MITKDAIEILKGIQYNLEETRFLEKCAIDMAIEALKTDIDLQDAYEQGYACGWKERFGEPKERRGEWIDLSDGWQEGTFECSNCKTEFVLIEGTPEDNEYNFCPNCGADMRKEDDA